mgnify:CR=1 FL=1
MGLKSLLTDEVFEVLETVMRGHLTTGYRINTGEGVITIPIGDVGQTWVVVHMNQSDD